ncbi:hypothetical protein SAMN05428964_105390 [Thalassospira xiamenensis]|uniref:Uncharacterized protein n=1 Tax=Thalassospira xiamenensis TaxID=220697 RepID=A0A285TTF4_9PROT|nr:hypothetical protein SAMN05428964_105390 [Thalassospira xiamenensis]
MSKRRNIDHGADLTPVQIWERFSSSLSAEIVACIDRDRLREQFLKATLENQVQ